MIGNDWRTRFENWNRSSWNNKQGTAGSPVSKRSLPIRLRKPSLKALTIIKRKTRDGWPRNAAVTQKHNPEMLLFASGWIAQKKWMSFAELADHQSKRKLKATDTQAHMNELVNANGVIRQTTTVQRNLNECAKRAGFLCYSKTIEFTHAHCRLSNKKSSLFKANPFSTCGWTTVRLNLTINLYLFHTHTLLAQCPAGKEWGYTGCTVWNYSTTRLSVFQVCCMRVHDQLELHPQYMCRTVGFFMEASFSSTDDFYHNCRLREDTPLFITFSTLELYWSMCLQLFADPMSLMHHNNRMYSTRIQYRKIARDGLKQKTGNREWKTNVCSMMWTEI